MAHEDVQESAKNADISLPFHRNTPLAALNLSTISLSSFAVFWKDE